MSRQNQPAPRYSVVGCRDCSTLWVVEDLRSHDHAECPACGARRQTSKLRPLAQHDEWDGIVELRSRILQDRANYHGDFGRIEDYGDFATLDDDVEDRLSRWSDFLGEHVDTPRDDRLEEQAWEYTTRWDDFFGDQLSDRRDDRLDEDVDEYHERMLAEDRTEPESIGSFTLTQQTSVSSVATVDLDNRPPSDVWKDIATSEGFQQALEAAVADLLDDVGSRQWGRRLFEAGVTAVDGAYARTIQNFARDVDPSDHAREDLVDEAHELTAQLGQQGMSLLGFPNLPLGAVRDGPVAAVAAAGRTHTLCVRLSDGFEERRSDQQRETCRLLAWLARAFDVRLITESLYQQRRFAQQFHDLLPGDVRQQCNTGHAGAPDATEKVEAAMDEFDVDGEVVAMLRYVADKDSETASYTELRQREHHISDESAETIRRRVANRLMRLREFDLVSEGFRGPDGTRTELLAAGRQYLDAIGRLEGVQQTLEESVSQTGNPSRHAVPKHAPAHVGEGEDSGRRLVRHHSVKELSRAEYAAAVETAEEGSFSMVNHRIQRWEDGASPHIHYSHSEDRLVVSCEYHNPMQYWVSAAHALASSQIFQWVATPERLEDGEFGQMFTDHRDVLRSSRCLGYLSDRLDDSEDYVEALQDARDELLEMTKEHYRGEYDDRKRFRGDITRNALGLAGTVVHLLDILGVEIVREVRIPTLNKFDDGDLRSMHKTLALGAAIQSSYGSAAAYRQLFETNDEKRRWSIDAVVDAADPVGSLIGSFVLVGNFDERGDDIRDRLTGQLADPEELHEDAPEFAIELDVVDEFGRDVYSQAARRVCKQKGLSPTREAVSVFQALTASPYDVAAALGRGLSPESKYRDIRVAEVRTALATLDAKQLLPGSSPTAKRVVSALLRATALLTKQELAEEAGVSTRSLRTHLPRLVAIGLVRETAEGYRLELSFNDDDERHSDVLPTLVGAQNTLARDVLHDALCEYIDRDGPLGGIDSPVWSVWYEDLVDGVPQVDRLAEHLPWTEWVLRVLRALDGRASESRRSRVRFGSDTEQAPLPTSSTGGASV